MRASLGLSVMVLAAAFLAAPPLRAQSTPASQQQQQQQGTVGPRELRDFSLPGTPAPAEPQPQQPTPQAPAPAPADEPASEAPASPRPVRQRPATRPSPPTVLETEPQPPAEAPRDLDTQLETAAPAEPEGSYSTQPDPVPAPLPSAAVPVQDNMGMLPWLLAALLVGLAAAYAAYRRRSRAAADHAASLEAFVPVEPPASPDLLPAGRPEARPVAPQGSGLVSARLRPSLELQLVPLRAAVDEHQATIDFSIVAFNTGSAPARDVKIEVVMLNAGPTQDQELGRFFAEPAGVGEAIDGIAPMGQISLNSRISLPLDRIRAFEVAGRKLFVPLLAFNALYRWGNNGEGQTSRSYLVGREGQGEKMAPLRLDLGPRIFGKLGARRHHLQLQR